MPSSPCLKGVTVAILAGGLGTRIRPVLGDVPKLLAPLAGKPFLQHLLDWIVPLGPQRILLCLGHGSQQVLAYLQTLPPCSVPLQTVVEPSPMGTAGALRYAGLDDETLLVMNGDTYVKGDLCQFIASHHAAQAEGSLLCLPVDDCRRYGTITLDNTGRIAHFVEKDPDNLGPGWISSGILLLTPPLVARLKQGSAPSLERDFLAVLPTGSLHAVIMDLPFIDFGVPESFHVAQGFFANIVLGHEEYQQ